MSKKTVQTRIITPNVLERIRGRNDVNPIPMTLFELIKNNMTDIDKRTYLLNGRKKFTPGVDLDQITTPKNSEFVAEFLSTIDEEKEIYKDYNKDLFAPLANFLKALDPEEEDLNHPTDIHIPTNRIYFNILANIYCNSLEYSRKYDWLSQLLTTFESEVLTGEFKLDKTDYNILFAKCHDENKIKSDLPFKITGIDVISHKNIFDYKFKVLANTSLDKLLKSSRPAVGWTKPQTVMAPPQQVTTSTTKSRKRKNDDDDDDDGSKCPYGANCRKLLTFQAADGKRVDPDLF